MTFRAGLARRNSTKQSDFQIVTGTGTFVLNRYASDFRFHVAALVVPLLSVVAVMAMMMGWWELERRVSMSPIEIAKALGAPLLDDSGPSGDAEEILKVAGTTKVVYRDNGNGKREIVGVGSV